MLLFLFFLFVWVWNALWMGGWWRDVVCQRHRSETKVQLEERRPVIFKRVALNLDLLVLFSVVVFSFVGCSTFSTPLSSSSSDVLEDRSLAFCSWWKVLYSAQMLLFSKFKISPSPGLDERVTCTTLQRMVLGLYSELRGDIWPHPLQLLIKGRNRELMRFLFLDCSGADLGVSMDTRCDRWRGWQVMERLVVCTYWGMFEWLVDEYSWYVKRWKTVWVGDWMQKGDLGVIFRWSFKSNVWISLNLILPIMSLMC